MERQYEDAIRGEKFENRKVKSQYNRNATYIRCKECGKIDKVDKSFIIKALGGAISAFGFYGWVTFLFAGTGCAMAIAAALVVGGVAVAAHGDEILKVLIEKGYRCDNCKSQKWEMFTGEELNQQLQIEEDAEKIHKLQVQVNKFESDMRNYAVHTKKQADMYTQQIMQNKIDDLERRYRQVVKSSVSAEQYNREIEQELRIYYQRKIADITKKCADEIESLKKQKGSEQYIQKINQEKEDIINSLRQDCNQKINEEHERRVIMEAKIKELEKQHENDRAAIEELRALISNQENEVNYVRYQYQSLLETDPDDPEAWNKLEKALHPLALQIKNSQNEQYKKIYKQMKLRFPAFDDEIINTLASGKYMVEIYNSLDLFDYSGAIAPAYRVLETTLKQIFHNEGIFIYKKATLGDLCAEVKKTRYLWRKDFLKELYIILEKRNSVIHITGVNRADYEEAERLLYGKKQHDGILDYLHSKY